MTNFNVLPHKLISTNSELYTKWDDIKGFLPRANNTKTSKIMFWTGHGGVFPYFVASGKSSPTGGRLSTGLTTPGFASSYPDFPRMGCFMGSMCTIMYEGMNILASNFITTNLYTYTGIVYVDFYGDDLAKMIIEIAAANYAKCTVLQVSQGCTLC